VRPPALFVALAGVVVCSVVAISLAANPWVWPTPPDDLGGFAPVPRLDSPAPASFGVPLAGAAPAVRIMVYPHRFALAPGQTQQACAFFQFSDRKVGRRSADALIPACDSIWRTRWRPATRAVALSQQLAIDARCPTEWSASGGIVGASGLFRPGQQIPGEYRLAAESPAGPCPGSTQPPAGLIHRRWRISYRAGGGVTLTIDPHGEWNTTADLMAWRVEAPFQAAEPQLASMGR
jgi:hypothetical protein